MAQPFEQDIILDADGRPLFNAFQYVEREVAKLRQQIHAIGRDSYKNVNDVGKVIAQQTRDLQAALAQMRMLTGPGSRAGDFQSAIKARGDESRNFYRHEEQERVRARREANRQIAAEERAGERAVAEANRLRTQREIEGVRQLHRNRVEAARSEAQDSAKALKNLDLLARAREENIEKLRRYRAAAKAASDPDQARALAVLIDLERARGRALEQTQRAMERQQATAERRAAGLSTQTSRALIPGDIRDMTARDGVSTTRLGLLFEQENARRRLMAATTEEERRAALANLDIANKRVAAINQLARAEEKVLATERRIAQQDLSGSHRQRMALARAYADTQIRTLGLEQAINVQKQRQVAAENALAGATAATRRGLQENLALENRRLAAIQAQARQDSARSPIQNILSPGYAAAAFARTSVYGGAAMAAYGAFNAVQEGLTGMVQLQDELARLQAISNSTDSQMQVLKSSIIEIGGASRFSLVDLTKIAQTLAQAGVSAGQMEEVLKSVTTLAVASGSTPDEAVNLVTSALGAFQLQSSEAARIADLMTNALNRTRLTVGQVGQAIQYVGSTAYEQNISLEQLLATIGAVAQAGVRSGSTIGTGFRQFLVDLQTPSEKLNKQLNALGLTAQDVDVSVRGLPAVLQTLRERGFGAAQAYAGLEVRAAAFYLTARNNIDVMDQLQLSFANQGAAAVANERAMNSLAAQWQRFKNLLAAGFESDFGALLVVVQDMITRLSDHIQRGEELAKELAERRTGGVQGYVDRAGGSQLQGAADYLNENLIRDTGNLLYKLQNAALDLVTPQFYVGGEGLGQRWDAYLTGLNRASEETEKFNTQVSESTDKVDQQRSKITELDQELQRLIVQKESLRNNDARSAAEIATLTSRFQGLAVHLQNTGNRYDDLTNAVKRYRQEQLRVLGMDLTAQGSALEMQTAQARRAGGQAVRTVQGNQGMMSQLSPQERGALQTLMTTRVGSLEAQRAQGVLGDAVRRFANSQPEIARALNNIVQQAGTISTNTAQLSSISSALTTNKAAQTPFGAQIADIVRNTEAAIQQLSSQQNGSSEKSALSRQTLGQLDTLEREIRKRLGIGMSQGAKDFLNSTLADLPGLRQQVKALNMETDEEKRTREKGDREAQKPRLVSQADIDAAGREFGLAPGSGRRSVAEQDRLHARGLTPATGATSSHSRPGGVARDFGVRGMSDREAELMAARLRAYYKGKGIDAFVQFERGGRNQGTGRHIHASTRPGTRVKGAGPDGGGDEGLESLREDITTNKLALNTSEDELRLRLKEMQNANSQQIFDAAQGNAQKALDQWEEHLRTVTQEELAASGALPNEAYDRMREMENQIRVAREEFAANVAQRVEKFQREIFSRLMKNLDNALDAAQRRFSEALQPSLDRVSSAQASLTGFGYQSNQGKIPDYVQQLAQSRLGNAEEASVRARAASLPNYINERQTALSQAQSALTDSNFSALNPEEVEAARNKVAALTQELANLRQEKVNLDAALSAGGLVPQTLTAGLQQAIAAWREANNVGRSFSDELIMNMGGAIETVQASLTNMFESIMNGSRTAMQAFGDFAKAIMNYIVQMVAKIIATKIIEFASRMMGVFTGGTPVEAQASASTGAIGMFNGGFNPNVPGYAVGGRGGEVSNGSGSRRDSVNAKIAKGEWVVRRDAVQSVGNRFMARLNQHGSKALDQLQSMPQVNVKPVTDLKVYMVKPEERPQLGANDILLTWQQDVLSGGESRKLIQHVVREG